jgi:hypothetical protein
MGKFVPLKGATHILFIFYFLVLTFVPCGDRRHANDFNQPCTLSAQPEEHSDEDCSPFCFCSCCATHIVVQDAAPQLAQLVSVAADPFNENESKPTAAIISIWQPPKKASERFSI